MVEEVPLLLVEEGEEVGEVVVVEEEAALLKWVVQVAGALRH